MWTSRSSTTAANKRDGQALDWLLQLWSQRGKAAFVVDVMAPNFELVYIDVAAEWQQNQPHCVMNDIQY